MIVAITGTPGIGKTSVSEVLRKKEFDIVDLNKVAVEKQFLIGVDKDRDSKIVDVDKLSKHIEKNYDGEDIVFIDGHLWALVTFVKCC
jgi:adenylate kinase